MARPTSCSQAIADAAIAYAKEYADYDHAVPSVVGLCSVINVARSTVYDWAKDNIFGFSDILERINEEQELVTFNKSLKGEYNATIAKLLLGKHGYHERSETSTNVTTLSHEEWLASLE